MERAPIQLELTDPNGNIELRTLDLTDLAPGAVEGDLLKEVGLTPFRPHLKPVIGRVLERSPAAAAGLVSGDEVLAIDGRPIGGWNELARAIRESPGRALKLEIARGDATRAVTVTPEAADEAGKRIGRIGIAAAEERGARAAMFVTVSLGPIAALQRATVQTWETSAFSLRMIGRMFTGDVSWKNVSGPITIADYAGQSARMGLTHYLKFLALISISLGVLNLLPIPILDGGHLLYYLAEIIKGGPLSERVMEVGQQIGLAILISLMVFAFYNDITRLVSG